MLKNTNLFVLPLTEGDSKNYLTYYKRAAVFLAMGKSKSALPDLTRAIQLKPDFLAVSTTCNLNFSCCDYLHQAVGLFVCFFFGLFVCPFVRSDLQKKKLPPDSD